MADVTWTDGAQEDLASRGINTKFIIGGALILCAVVVLFVAGTLMRGQPFISINELLRRPDLVGKTVQTSGVVIGETIRFQDDPMELRFTVANISGDVAHIKDVGGLAEALHQAASDTATSRMPVVVINQPMPDLLQHEAQAILTGALGEDGVFYATDLMLKCSTRYDEAVPEQADD